MKVKHTANRLLSLLLVLALAAGFMCIPGLAVSDEPGEYVEEDRDDEIVAAEDGENAGEDQSAEDIPEADPEEPDLNNTILSSDSQPLSVETLAGDTVASGTFNSGAEWEIYDSGDGTYELYITGEGAMNDFSSSRNQSWSSYRSNITSVYIGDGITRIGKYAFASFTALVDVYIGSGVEEIGGYAFQSCSSLDYVDIPYGVVTIETYAFNNTALEDVWLPDTVTSLGNYVFANCSDLAYIYLPDSLTSIGTYAFNNCKSLPSITFPELVTTIPQRVCEGCTSLQSVTFRGDIEEIGNRAFYGCTALTDITLLNTLETIGSSVFQGCSSLTDIIIPDSVMSVGDNCFNNCVKLSSVTLSSSMEEIGSYAFSSCTSLTEIAIPASVTSIAANAFSGCTKLSSVTFEGDAPSMKSTSFNNVTATCYYYPGFTWTSGVRTDYGGTLTWVPLTDDIIDITVYVDWEDEDHEADRPEEVTVVLYADGEEAGTVVISAADNWAYVIEEMPVYDRGGGLITYSVSVYFVNGYAYSEGTVACDDDGNLYIEIVEATDPNSTSVSFEIRWDDDNDRDGIRPEDAVTVTILVDDVEYDTLTVYPDENGNLAGTFEDVPKYAGDGSAVEYTFSIDAEDYTCSYSGDDSVITATHEPYMTLVNNGTGVLDVSVEGEDDAPEAVTVVLYADGDVLDTLTLSADNGWSGAFTDLYQYVNGDPIEYTLSVQKQDGYLFSVIQDTDDAGCVSLAIVCVLNQVSIVATVVFADDGDRDGVRPTVGSVEVALTVDGEYLYYGEASPESGWTYTFTVPAYDDDGNEIRYELTCTTLDNYDCEIDGYTIIFTHNPVTYDITVEKVWEDNDDEAGVRPDSVTVTLYGNSEEVAAGEITAEDGWVYTFTDMPADENGENIVYSVEETSPDGRYYVRTQTAVGDDEEENGVVYDPYSFIITNIYTSGSTCDFTICKYALGDEGSGIALAGAEFTLRETSLGEAAWFSYDDSSSVYSFSGWDYEDGLTDTLVSGEDGCIAVRSLPEGSYDLTETAAPDGYELPGEPVSITANEDLDGTTVYVENFPPEPLETGSYIYKYSDNGGVNGAQFDVEAMDGTCAWFYTENDGTYTFAGWNLDADEDFNDEGGAYTEVIDTSNNVGVDGLIYIAGLEPGDYYLNEFLAPEDYIGLDDELLITLNEDGTLYYKFASSDESSHLAPDGVVKVYNEYIGEEEPETRDIMITALWDDSDNRDDPRPDSLTVTIFANGIEAETLVLNEENGWTATIQDAAVTDENGDAIEYTVSVEDVDGYVFTASSEEDDDGTLIWTITGTVTSAEPEEPEVTPTPEPSETPEPTPEPSETPEATPEPSETPEATPEPSETPEPAETETTTPEPSETEEPDDSTASETPVPGTDDEEEPETSVAVVIEEDGSVTITVTGLVDIRQLIMNNSVLTLGEDYTAEFAAADASGEGIWIITVFPETLAAMDDIETLEVIVTGGNAAGEIVDATGTLEDTGLHFILGDVNGDGIINISDVQALLKYVNGQDVFVIHPALDVNADETVNISDVQLLLKYVNGQNVVLGIQGTVSENQDTTYAEWSRNHSFMSVDGDLVEILLQFDSYGTGEGYLAVYLNGRQIMACDTDYTTDPDGLIYYYRDAWSDNLLAYNYARGFVVVYDENGSAIMATLDNYMLSQATAE